MSQKQKAKRTIFPANPHFVPDAQGKSQILIFHLTHPFIARGRPRFGADNWVVIIASLIFLSMVGIWLIISTKWLLVDLFIAQNIDQNGQTLEASVIDRASRVWVYKNGVSEEYYEISYHYEINGISYERTETVPYSIYFIAQVGGKIQAHYLPDYPTRVELIGNSLNVVDYDDPILFYVLAWPIYIVLTICDVWYFFYRIKATRQWRVVMGTITNAYFRSSSDNLCTLCVDYSFKSPRSTKLIRGHTFLILKGTITDNFLPPKDTRIKVLYVSEKDFEVI